MIMKSKTKVVNRPKASKPAEQEKTIPLISVGESMQTDAFEQTVEKGKRIKEKIRRLYEEKFTAETIQRDTEFANEIIQAASFMGKNVDLYGSEEFNPKASFELDPRDSLVSKNAKVGVFPVSEQRMFPPRRKLTGWEVGLRKYDPSEKKVDKIHTIGQNAGSDQRHDHQTIQESKTREFSMMNINLTELKKAQYATRKLPELTTEITDHYFDSRSVEKFHETYHQLQNQGTILVGGYDELHEIVKENEEENILTISKKMLSLNGTLTPRDGSSQDRKNMIPRTQPRPKSSSATSRPRSRAPSSQSSPVIGKKALRSVSSSSISKIFNEIDLSASPKLHAGESTVGWGEKSERSEVPSPEVMSPLTKDRRPSSAVLPGPLEKQYSQNSTASWTVDSKVEEDASFVEPLELSRLDDSSYVDTGGDMAYNPASPRAVFLAGCLKHGLPPRAHVLLRKRISTSINLAHIGIGNQMAKVLAEALPTLPYLQAINLSDNNLEDDGLSAIIRAIAQHATIEIVDISQNIIGSEAAQALAEFVGNPDCKLQCLRMSDANIDDGECAAFVEVLMNNRHLKELDMSKNLLGKDENLNTVQPDFTTGGESLAELLKEGLCPIQTLNLHWNMIRLEGAEVLCDSIRSNIHLMNLDLSYNALGSAATCILGAALMENKTLRVLNIANNGIDTIGCFTLFVGLKENKSLCEINIDGNPIGEQGARILMKTVAFEGHRLTISAKNCDISIKSGQTKFHLEDPFGEYVLDLSKPYDRAILLELLDIAANDPNVLINTLEYTVETVATSAQPSAAPPPRPDSQPNSRPASANPAASKAGAKRPMSANPEKPVIGGIVYKIVRFDDKSEPGKFSEDEKKEFEFLQSFQLAIEMNPPDFYAMAKKYDSQGKGTVSTVGMKRILNELKLQQIPKLMSEIKFTIDPSNSGYYGIDEFVEYIVERCKVVRSRLKHMTCHPKCALYRPGNPALASSSVRPSFTNGQLTKYVPPTSGTVYLKVIESYDVSSDESEVTSPLTDSQCKQIIKAAKESANPLKLMLYAIESFQLHLEEAQLLIKEIGSRSDDPTLALSHILLRMKSSFAATRLMHCYTHNDIVKIRRLKQRLGNAYYPLVGMYSGYYVLDLSNEMDRLCLKKLIEKSVKNTELRRRSGLWDTSQNGNWSCFRNEVHYSQDPDRTISPKYFFPIPSKGKLEFDFVNIERPNPAINRAADYDRIIDVLLISCLLEEDAVKDVSCRINDLNLVSRRNLLPNGNPYWRTSLAKAQAISDHLHQMYSTLSHRHASRKKALKRELIKSQLPPDKGKDKRKTEKLRSSGFYSSSASVKKAKTNEIHHTSTGNVTNIPETVEEAAPEPVAVNPKLLAKVKKVAGAFRSLVYKSRADSTQKSWGKRLHEVVKESTGSDEYKSVNLLEFFEAELTSLWLYCVHLSVILELFTPFGMAGRSSMGSYRVELVVMLFDRIIDLHNFEFVLMVLNAEEQAALYARLGLLNVFNPMKPEGGYAFDLHRWEERQVTKILIHLSVVEPGENWLNKEFMFDRGFLPMPGWDLNITWLNEEGLPKKGLLSFEVFAGDGTRQLGCCVDIKLRSILTSLVLVGQRDYLADIARGDQLSEEKMFNYQRGNKNPTNFFPGLPLTKALKPPALPIAASTVPMGETSASVVTTTRDSQTSATTSPRTEGDIKPEDSLTSVTAESSVELLPLVPNQVFKPLLPLLKLMTQSDILAQLSSGNEGSALSSMGDFEFRRYTFDDANRHLQDETDVTWTYTSTNQKYESWLVK